VNTLNTIFVNTVAVASLCTSMQILSGGCLIARLDAYINSQYCYFQKESDSFVKSGESRRNLKLSNKRMMSSGGGVTWGEKIKLTRKERAIVKKSQDSSSEQLFENVSSSRVVENVESVQIQVQSAVESGTIGELVARLSTGSGSSSTETAGGKGNVGVGSPVTDFKTILTGANQTQMTAIKTVTDTFSKPTVSTPKEETVVSESSSEETEKAEEKTDESDETESPPATTTDATSSATCIGASLGMGITMLVNYLL